MCKLRIGGISRANCSVFRVVQCVSSGAVCFECCSVLRVLQCVAVENRGHVEGELQCVSSVAVCCGYCSVL